MNKQTKNILMLSIIAALVLLVLWLVLSGTKPNPVPVGKVGYTPDQAATAGVFPVPGGPDVYMYTDTTGVNHYGTIMEMMILANADQLAN
jgi:hypothetical protein